MATCRVRSTPTIVILLARPPVDGETTPQPLHAPFPDQPQSVHYNSSSEFSAFDRLVKSGRVTGADGNLELECMEPHDSYTPDKCGSSYLLVVSVGDHLVDGLLASQAAMLVFDYLLKRSKLPRHVQVIVPSGHNMLYHMQTAWQQHLADHAGSGLSELVVWDPTNGTTEAAA